MNNAATPDTYAKTVAYSEDFNFDWRFSLRDEPNANRKDYDDSSWRLLDLPHDWSVEFPFDPVNGDGATGYLPGGIGWYRKRFQVEAGRDLLHFVLFDGVYNNCEIWCNDRLVGRNPYGYSPFWFDLTPLLGPDNEDQVIAVRVDHSRYIDSRWYTGSGIYRDVRLISKPRLHIPVWGTRLTTPEVSATHAKVELEITVNNFFSRALPATICTQFLDASDTEVVRSEETMTLEANDAGRCVQSVVIPSPQLWSPDRPILYRARTCLRVEGTLYEVYETPFGIRDFVFDPDDGFILNGKGMKIKGVCLHHDAGLVGAAVPDGVWRRRLSRLKAMGCNAVRTAHNPASERFLDLCDKMGFLVQEEFFDEWDAPKDKRLNTFERHDDFASRGYTEHFQDWAESDLKRTMLRDRNHPCIIQWSIGNEIEWTYPRYASATGYFTADASGNYFWTHPPYSADDISARFEELPEGEHVLTHTAAKLAGWTREMDRSRPVTANCILPSVSHISGYASTLDVVGYSYRQIMYDLCHSLYPDIPIMGAENLGQWHEWQHVIERQFISGLFFWTGVDYLGEAHDKWPLKATPSGLIDLAGFERASYHMMQTLWCSEPHAYLTTQLMEHSPYRVDEAGAVVEKEPGAWRRRLWFWHDVKEHWNYAEKAAIAVEVYANCEEVELFLNGRSLGSQCLADQEDRIFKWAVPFQAGTLKARGRTGDDEVAASKLVTAAAPASITLSADRTEIRSDGYDIVHLVAQVVDEHAQAVRNLERDLVFSISGECRILGIDNGAADSVQTYRSNRITTSKGRALMILQSTRAATSVTAFVMSGHLRSPEVRINIT